MEKRVQEWVFKVYVNDKPVTKGLVKVDKCGLFPIRDGEAIVRGCPVGTYQCSAIVYEYDNKKVEYESEYISVYLDEWGWSGINISEEDIFKKEKVSIPEKPKEEPKKEKEEVIVELGLWNPLKIVADAEIVKSEVNKICNFVGWNCYKVETSISKIVLYFEKYGSPALPIMAIIGAIAIIVTGAVIISINWRMVRVEEEETKQELEKTKQLQENRDLFEGITEEYNKGLITDEVYNELIEQLGYAQFQITKPKPSEEKEGFGWEDIPQMVAGFVPLFFLFLILSSLSKR